MSCSNAPKIDCENIYNMCTSSHNWKISFLTFYFFFWSFPVSIWPNLLYHLLRCYMWHNLLQAESDSSAFCNEKIFYLFKCWDSELLVWVINMPTLRQPDAFAEGRDEHLWQTFASIWSIFFFLSGLYCILFIYLFKFLFLFIGQSFWTHKSLHLSERE
jgi:hypothetical protein